MILIGYSSLPPALISSSFACICFFSKYRTGPKDPIHGAGDGRHPERRGRKGGSVQSFQDLLPAHFLHVDQSKGVAQQPCQCLPNFAHFSLFMSL